MIITVYLLRLITHGPPDISLILSAFVAIGPLGQGGYSLLVNGEALSLMLPTHLGDTFPNTPLAGQIVFGVCFCGAYLLWSMAICWVIIAIFSIGNQIQKGRIPFSIAYWFVAPNLPFLIQITYSQSIGVSSFLTVYLLCSQYNLRKCWTARSSASSVHCGQVRTSLIIGAPSHLTYTCSLDLSTLVVCHDVDDPSSNQWVNIQGALPCRTARMATYNNDAT
jgi:hypothetical protein